MPSYSKTFIITDFNKSQDDLIFNEAKEEVYKNFSFLNLTQNTSENNFYLNIGLQNFYTEFVLNEVTSNSLSSLHPWNIDCILSTFEVTKFLIFKNDKE